jgi:hypothetical protein
MNPGVVDGGIKYVTKDLWVDYDIAQKKCYGTSGTTINNNLSTQSIYSATTINGPTYDSARGGNLNFDGINEFVNIDNTGTKTFPNGFSVEAWVREGTTFLGTYNWVGISGISQGSSWTDGWGLGWSNAMIYTANQGFFFWVTTGKGANPTIALFTGGTYGSGTTYHVVGTYDGTNIKVYRDGTVGYQTSTATIVYPEDSRPIYIMYLEGVSSWGGNLYIYRIYERALTATEVSQNYDALKSRFT